MTEYMVLTAVQPINHIVKSVDVAGGCARVAGRRVPVYQIAYLHEWESIAVADIAERFDITPAHVYAALAYYHDHQSEIHQEIAVVDQAGPPEGHRPAIEGVLARWQEKTGHNPGEELSITHVSEEYGIDPVVVKEGCEKGWVVARQIGGKWLIRRLSAHSKWAK